MKTAFFPYSVDDEGRLNLYWTTNNIINNVFVAEAENIKDDIIDEVLNLLELDLNSPRVSFLGTFTLDNIFLNKNQIESEIELNELDCIAFNVTGMNMKPLESKYSLKHNPAFTLNVEQNTLLLAIIFKLIMVKKNMSNSESEVEYIDNTLDSEIPNTDVDIDKVSSEKSDDIDDELPNPNFSK
jgi:hypothetical protein